MGYIFIFWLRSWAQIIEFNKGVILIKGNKIVGEF